MLIVRRRSGQSILIGGDVEIQIIAVGPTQVKIGIIAPDHVTVQRKEISLTRAQNLTAAEGSSSEHLAAVFQRIRSGFTTPRANRQNPDSAVPPRRTTE